jgi:hypothetical protein
MSEGDGPTEGKIAPAAGEIEAGADKGRRNQPLLHRHLKQRGNRNRQQKPLAESRNQSRAGGGDKTQSGNRKIVTLLARGTAGTQTAVERNSMRNGDSSALACRRQENRRRKTSRRQEPKLSSGKPKPSTRHQIDWCADRGISHKNEKSNGTRKLCAGNEARSEN